MTRFACFLCLLASCGGSDNTEDTDPTVCTETTGTLEGVVLKDYGWSEADPTPCADGTVTATDSDGTDLQIATDTDGAFSVELLEGSWTLSATNGAGDCFSEEELTVDIAPCKTVQMEVNIQECFD